MALDRGIRGSEGPTINDIADHQPTGTFAEVHASFKCVFTNRATPDRGKSDEQLNHELNNSPPIYGTHDTTSSAIEDLQKGIKSDGRTRHDLGSAIERAAVGDKDGAIEYLRKATSDLNDAGGKIDNGLRKLGDDGQSDGSRTIKRAMKNEADCSENIQRAEELLRDGHFGKAIEVMTKGIREVAHRQHQTRDGIASIQSDDNNVIDWNNYGPMNSSSGSRIGGNVSDSDYGRGSIGRSNSNGSGDTSFYPEHNQGDQYFDSQQRVIRPTNGGWNSTQPFYPDNSGSYSPGGDYNGSYDYNGNYGPRLDTSPTPSASDIANGLPSPFDIARDLGLPTPPSPSDVLNSLPNPFDMFGGGGSNGGGGHGGGGSPFDMFGGLPNPTDMFGGGGGNGGGGGGNGGGSPFDMFGGLPNPTDMFGGGSEGGGGLPNPFDIFGGGDDSESGGDESWPNPGKGLSDIMHDPTKPIKNLLKPPKSPKDLVHKILDPIGLFG